MNRPEQHFRARLAVLVAGGALIAALFPMAGSVLAASTVTSATGGAAISADTALTAPGSNTSTLLAGPSIAVTAAGDIAIGTITITAPTGFEFPSALTPTVTVGATGATIAFLTGTTTVLTFDVTVANTAAGTVAFSGIRVVPIAGTPLASGELQIGGTAGVTDATAGLLTEVPGAPIITIPVQPSTTAASGVVFAIQPTVHIQDQFANPRIGDSILLSISTAPTGGVLTCTATTVLTNGTGNAVFAGCKLDKVGSYILRATDQTATATILTTAISITAGPATKFGFSVQPARGVPATAFAVQPSVAIQDAQGNTVTTATATAVTLAIGTNAGAGTLTCTTNPIPTTNGVATFSGCRINNVGVGYTLTASGGFTVGTSLPFDVADRLAFSTQPAGAVGGVAFTTQPVVTVRAGATAVATNDNASVVTLAIKAGTGATGAVLTCTNGLTRTVVAGAATFAGCMIDKSSPTGNPYVLVATSPSLTSAESTSMAATAGPASKVLFTVQPAATNVGVAFAVAPAVSITDAGGNVATTGTDSTRSITLAIGTNPGAGTLTCTGGLTRAAVAGVATFTGCSISGAGVGYTLTASSTGLTSATSTAFNVTAPAAVITLTRSRGMITYGETVTFSVQFGASGGNKPFVLEYQSVGVPFATIASLTTNAAGFASFTYTPTRTGYIRARFAGTADLSAANSTVFIVGVRQTVSLRPTHTGTLSIARGRSIAFRVTVRPLRADLAASSVTYRFYHKVDGSWVLATERHILTDSSGVARTTFRFSQSGSWYVRAYAPRTPYNSITRFTQRELFSVQ